MRTLKILTSVVFIACGSSEPSSSGMDASIADSAPADLGSTFDAGARDSGETGSFSNLELALRQRLDGDRTGACVAAVRVAPDGVESGIYSAPGRDCGIEKRFEIGSISKTMVGLLVTRLVEQGQLQLEDPASNYLPVELPRWGDEPIRLRHLLAHTSGLPSLPAGFLPADLTDPYAGLTAEQLWLLLPGTPLAGAPGEAWSYSNLGYMLLSSIVARTAEVSFPELIRTVLFEPLGMVANITDEPDLPPLAIPHLPTGEAVPPWRFDPELAGVGGVRATLDAMQRYARLVAGGPGGALSVTMDAAAQALPSTGEPAMASGFILVSVAGRQLYFHDGGTGGSSSMLVADRAAQTAVVVLSNTSWSNLGGLDALAIHLLDPALAPNLPPRRATEAPPELVDALVGRYQLASEQVELVAREGRLAARLADGTLIPFGYDSYGDFYPEGIDALLTPVLQPGQPATFDWLQGVMIRAVRL